MTTTKALLIVTVCYASTALSGSALFRFVEAARGVPDPHRATVTAAWAALMAVAWLWSVAMILRGRPSR